MRAVLARVGGEDAGATSYYQGTDMSAKGNRYLVADIVALLLAAEGEPLWVAYDQQRRRFTAETRGRPGRVRTQVGPYTREHALWQIEQDVETAVSSLKERMGMRA